MITFGGIRSPVRAFLRNSRKASAEASFSISMDSASDASSASALRNVADFFCSLANSARVLRQKSYEKEKFPIEKEYNDIFLTHS